MRNLEEIGDYIVFQPINADVAIKVVKDTQIESLHLDHEIECQTTRFRLSFSLFSVILPVVGVYFQ